MLSTRSLPAILLALLPLTLASPVVVPIPSRTSTRPWTTRNVPVPTGTTKPTITKEGCTTTMTATDMFCLGMTETVYTETITSTTAVDCDGCPYIEIETPLYACPAIQPGTTITAVTPSTTWSTICEPSGPYETLPPVTPVDSIVGGELDDEWDEDIEGNPYRRDLSPLHPDIMQRRRPQEEGGAACTTTFHVQPKQTSAMTYTWFAGIITTTLPVPCGGCDLEVDTELMAPGAPQFTYEATVTVEEVTSVIYTCM